MAAFGIVPSPWALLAFPAAILTGAAFAAPVMAFSATRDTDQSFVVLYRFGIVPLFLFSGTFFPVSQLPGWLQVVARCTPLYQGVTLCRAFVLGRPGELGQRRARGLPARDVRGRGPGRARDISSAARAMKGPS